jgi:NAD(P)-dependent dehydrogenase (short-subunit alcohol dehydrogenase family)
VRRRCDVAGVRTVVITATSSAERAVLVTGASSGIGYASAEALARAGAVVYAGVRTEADATRLREIGGRVRSLMLDVTKADEIADAVERIRGDGVPLVAVVSNAGIALGGPLEFMPLDRLRYQLEVNLIGAFAVAQAMLPLLRETKGRIVFIGSISGRITPPFIGPYAASKAALAALSDVLRFELDASGSGIDVSLFEFGNIRTPIWEKGRSTTERLERDAPVEQQRYYGFLAAVMRKSLTEQAQHGSDVAIAANAIAKAALGRARPRERYVMAGGAKAAAIMAAVISTRARGRLLRRVMGLP